MAIPTTLRFGIQSLDQLIGKDSKGINYGIDLSEPPDTNPTDKGSLPLTSSVCLSGPDGTGKSVFSLHMASHYLGDCLSAGELDGVCPPCPKVLYISTDLTYKMALKAWYNFALDCPFERREPLIESRLGRKPRARKSIEIKLDQYFPAGDSNNTRNIVDFLEKQTDERTGDRITAHVCFVDLASKTAGDDWGFVHRLISTLRSPGKGSPRHLIIMDAVEGFETLVGNLDAFGEESSRRSRVAQVMRIAAGKCHLVFVIEEGRDQRFPEEFVTDVVVRLRSTEVGKYLRRTVEVEKARGQSHVRGRHPFVIRDGQGSTTGDQANADEPGVRRSLASPFKTTEFINPIGFAEKLAKSEDPLSSYLRKDPQLSKNLRLSLKDPLQPLNGSLVEDVNSALQRAPFPRPGRFKDQMSEETLDLFEKKVRGRERLRLNRSFLEDLFPDEIARCYQSYVHVFSSLHHHSREMMIDKSSRVEDRPAYRHAAFGIPFLDNMLGGYGERAEVEQTKKEEGSYDTRGLPCATTTALIGDSLTQKSQLGRAFLSRTFLPFAEALADLLMESKNQFKSGSKKSISESKLDALREQYDPVAVMFTTRPTNMGVLEGDFYNWLQGSERVKVSLPGDGNIRELFESELKRFIRQHTICRRFELHDISAPVLMHIFQGNIEKAQRIMLRQGNSKNLKDDVNKLFCESWRIRIVIDDLSSFRDTFPEMRDDPLMLPALLFMLNREGVTSLIIDTQSSGSPELPITERFDSAVRELVETRIYTWRLPFYGESRVAINLIPPISHEHRGVIRELRPETKGERKTDRALIVDPHFELYLGLEKGQPEPVPLEVHLYAETDNVRKYIDAEEIFLRNVFTPVPPDDSSKESVVIKKTETADYDALRDSCHLQRDTRTDHTTILQVDEFWWLRKPHQRRAGAFRQQWDYLNAVTTTPKENQKEKEKPAKKRANQKNQKYVYTSDPVTDPFGVFQPPPFANKDNEAREKRRLNFFDDDCGYEFLEIRERQKQKQERHNQNKNSSDEDTHTEEEIREESYIDRIPFTWDFGFLLCNEKAWREAGELEIPHYTSEKKDRVKDIWDRLVKANRTTQSGALAVSWREFLAASKVVANVQSYRTSTSASTFDFTMLTPESFSCLILEMWCSEVFDCLTKYKTGRKGERAESRLKGMLDRVGRRAWSFDLSIVEPRTLLDALQYERGSSLEEILIQRRKSHRVRGFSLELYKVWLLLLESLTLTDLVDTSSNFHWNFKSKDVSVNAVSARHWYKTASTFMDSLSPEQLESSWLPVRLPGHFSVRADWFLAVAGGSRSNRLADHALDLLSSQRSNVTRLQQGVGLPTRDLFFKQFLNGNESNRESFKLRTHLISANEENSLTNVLYDELQKVGASRGDPQFHWLWRSRISAYNRQSRIWHKWLNRCVLWWNSWRQRYGSNWTEGFKVYDIVQDAEFNSPKRREELKKLNLESWKKFGELRDILIAELEEVNIPSN
jgi:KaiC/GvpD/RAD55 family RecA-like ATPase